jgi:hypothetical protein
MPRPPAHPLYRRGAVPGSTLRKEKGINRELFRGEVNLTLPAEKRYLVPGESSRIDMWQLCIRAAEVLKLVDAKGRPNPDHFLTFAAAFVPANQWLINEMVATDPGRGGDDCLQRRTDIWRELRDELRKICAETGIKRGTIVRASLSWLLEEFLKYQANPTRKCSRKEFFERFVAGPYQTANQAPSADEAWKLWAADNEEEMKDERFRKDAEELIRPRILSGGEWYYHWWLRKGGELMAWPSEDSQGVPPYRPWKGLYW